MYKLVYLTREAPTETIPHSTQIGPINAFGHHVLSESCRDLSEKLHYYAQRDVRIATAPGQLYRQTALALSKKLRERDIRPCFKFVDGLGESCNIADIIRKTVEEASSSIVVVTTATNISTYTRHLQNMGCTPARLNIDPGRLLLLNHDL